MSRYVSAANGSANSVMSTSAPVSAPRTHRAAVGETAVAYARIMGSALAAQLVLHAAKATEGSNDWLSAGPHPAPKAPAIGHAIRGPGRLPK